MSRDYYVPTSVVVTIDQAKRAAEYLSFVSQTMKEGPLFDAICAVSDALYALSNDTDCIVTCTSVLENNDE